MLSEYLVAKWSSFYSESFEILKHPHWLQSKGKTLPDELNCQYLFEWTRIPEETIDYPLVYCPGERLTHVLGFSISILSPLWLIFNFFYLFEMRRLYDTMYKMHPRPTNWMVGIMLLYYEIRFCLLNESRRLMMMFLLKISKWVWQLNLVDIELFKIIAVSVLWHDRI